MMELIIAAVALVLLVSTYIIGRKVGASLQEADPDDFQGQLEKKSILLKTEQARANLLQNLVDVGEPDNKRLREELKKEREAKAALDRQLKVATANINDMAEQIKGSVSPNQVVSYRAESAKFRALKNAARKQGKEGIARFNAIAARVNENVLLLKKGKGDYHPGKRPWTNPPTRIALLKASKSKG